jgi:hypothetical protein
LRTALTRRLSTRPATTHAKSSMYARRRHISRLVEFCSVVCDIDRCQLLAPRVAQAPALHRPL